MSLQSRTVAVKHLPEVVNHAAERVILNELLISLDANRPRIVINCSKQTSPSMLSIHLLLCSLEEAMKRNGDVRLSAVPKALRAMLQSAGMDRLFRFFDTDVEAIESFQRHSNAVNLISFQPSTNTQASESAA
jgi:anti-anti-sigma regulatory factor